MDDVYSNIREILGDYIGKRVVDITQHDQDEWDQTHQSYVCLLFEDGKWIRFPVGDTGFNHGEG